jgi:hypothetical protein
VLVKIRSMPGDGEFMQRETPPPPPPPPQAVRYKNMIYLQTHWSVYSGLRYFITIHLIMTHFQPSPVRLKISSIILI